MKIIATLFALASLVSIRAEPIQGFEFTVNLVTDVWDMSVTPPGDQQAIAWNNATIQHTFWNHTYNVVGSMIFNETDVKQTYQVHTGQWSKIVDLTIDDPKDQQHADIAIARDGSDGMGIKFSTLSGWDAAIKQEPKDM